MGSTARDRPGPDGAAELERRGQEAFRRHDYDEALRSWEAAYAAYRAAGDGRSASRVARNVAPVHGTVKGDWAVASGWIARAKSLSEDAGTDERGWVALNEGMFEPDRRRKDDLLGQAMAAGRESGDAGLLFVSMSYYGASLVHGNRVDEGMRLLDEALAAASGGELEDPVHIEEVACQLFSACEVAYDVDRAEQWLRVGLAAAEETGLTAAAAYCHTHYGGVMTAAGRWSEAESSLVEGIRLWVLSHRTLRSAAVARLAALRAAQGRVDEASALLTEVPEDLDSARTRAALSADRGDLSRARGILARALREADPEGLATVPLLAQRIELELAAGDEQAAAEQLALLDRFETGRQGLFVAATLALARGRLARATDAPDACDELRDAADLFDRARLPLQSAIARMGLAEATAPESPELAVTEARLALTTFEGLRAERYADAAAAYLRSLGVRLPAARPGGGTLTARELQVLALLGQGLTNQEVADRLVLSRKTVEHHVSRILVRLDLRNRSEAAAYAVRTGVTPAAVAPDRGRS